MPRKDKPKVRGSKKRKYVKGVGDPTKLQKPLRRGERTPKEQMEIYSFKPKVGRT